MKRSLIAFFGLLAVAAFWAALVGTLLAGGQA